MKAKVWGNLFLEEHFCGKECAFRQKQPEGGEGQFLGWDSEKRGIHLMCCFLFICDFYQSVKHLWRPKQDQTSELGVGGEGDREETPWPLHSRHSACWVEGPPTVTQPLGDQSRVGEVCKLECSSLCGGANFPKQVQNNDYGFICPLWYQTFPIDCS